MVFNPKSFSLLVLLFVCACNQANNDSNKSISDLEHSFETISLIENTDERDAATDTLWNKLISDNQIPFTNDSTAIFLYRGEAENVQWHGDFNSWSSDSKFPNKGVQVAGTNIWKLKAHFPSDARIDYKIAVDDEWILDPINPNYQWSGFGPNSELRMTKWEPEPLLERIAEAPKGTLSDNKIIKSSQLGYSVQYRIYTPANYDSLENLPVLYVLDGHEYADDNLGAVVIMLDNLIHLEKIQPLVAVFVDPRDPNNLDSNRRTQEFGTNSNYNDFFIEELIPSVNSSYNISTEKENVALLGTSLGGLNTTYLGFKNPDIFGNLAIQAPAFWFKEKEIFDLVRTTETSDFNIFMSAGTINDNILDAQQMMKEFERLKLNPNYVEVNEGHSWGAWSAQIDDILLQFFPNS